MHGNRNFAAHHQFSRSHASSRHAFANNRFAHGFGRGFRGRNWGYRYGWDGGVYWPFFYGDVFSYAFWPDDYYYDDGFWGYGYDGFYESLFWNSDSYYGGYGYRGRRRASSSQKEQAMASTEQSPTQTASCNGFAPGVTDFPIQRFEKAIQPDEQQRGLLNDLKEASEKAAQKLQEACPAQTPLTPLAKLDAMKARFAAVREAITIVRTPLDRLYNSLNDQQRQRFNALGRSQRTKSSQSSSSGLVEVCNKANASFLNIPVSEIEQTASLDEAQKQKLTAVKDAAAESADILKGSCPASVPQSPADRLNAVQTRIDALSKALDNIQSAVNAFYTSLSDEQKAHFNLAQQDGSTRSPG